MDHHSSRVETRAAKAKRIRRNWDLLPEFIIHQILCYLPTKEAARTSVLSKTWLQSYSTSPVLDFDESYFVNSPEIEEDRYPFFDFVNNTLFRYTSLNLRIHKFKIKILSVDQAPVYRLLDKSLGVAFDNGALELDISVGDGFLCSPYTLPPTMFDSLSVLTYLRVDKCKFPQNVATSSKLCNSIIFPYLKTLDLRRADINDVMLQKLFSSSPSLEKIVFCHVSGFQKFRVTDLDKLKILDIRSCSIKAFEIDIEAAPRLHFLKYLVSYHIPCFLKVGRAQNLKRLQLQSLNISDDYLEGLIRKSPLLEDLEITSCNGLERINVVSDSLKHFEFSYCEKLVEAKIDAPSLLKLDYSGENALSLSLVNTPEELKTYISINKVYSHQVSNEWFLMLGVLLKGVNQATVSFNMLHRGQGIVFCIAHDFSANPLPLEHQNEMFMPQINQSSSLFAVLVETLFSGSRPITVDTCLLDPFYVDFIKFLGSELMTATRSSNCCSSNQTKCWRHYLKDIEVEVYKKSQNVWQPLHLETSLSEFLFCGKKICFSLKWYANLNAKI